MKRNIIHMIVACCALFCTSCTDYLDAKPDRALATIDNLRDIEALLDDEERMNTPYPEAGEIAADYYFVNESDWASRHIDARNTYIWNADAQNRNDWQTAYTRIAIANIVLDEIDEIDKGDFSEAYRLELKGRAYFYRGFNYFQLAQLYCPDYAIGRDDSAYGLPLQVKSDINELVVRSTVRETYDLIVSDLENAIALLPDKTTLATRPSKIAALAALARLYLIMEDYEKARQFAAACLGIDDALIDYNHIDPAAAAPFTVLNKEVLFHAVFGRSGFHFPTRAYVAPSIVSLYGEDDLRKAVLLREEPNGLFRFKGSYEGFGFGGFCGLAIDEVFLIKAESELRLGLMEESSKTLNQLLIKRHEKSRFIPVSLDKEVESLNYILEERQRQLLFRGGIRWSDLRRLNRDPRFAKDLSRQIGENVYYLPANDIRYTFLLPFDVITMSGIPQNDR